LRLQRSPDAAQHFSRKIEWLIDSARAPAHVRTFNLQVNQRSMPRTWCLGHSAASARKEPELITA
jgi:hypothetical protein